MGTGVWNIVIYTINGFAFLLIGLQLPAIARQLTAYTGVELATWAIVISATVIVARIVWVFPATYLPRILSAKVRARDPSPPPQAVFVIAWAGMRGACRWRRRSPCPSYRCSRTATS
jgi:CPA1 family monovalent cation:H+ antiporter